MSGERSGFSIKAVLVTAGVSFLISGVGGALLQDHLSKAKPRIIVSSVGFDGGDGLVELADELIELSEKDAWHPNLSKFEPFDTLRQREREAAAIEQKLRTVLDITELWLDEHRTGPPQVSETALLRYPYLNDNTFGSSLNGSIRRSEIKPLPASDVSNVEYVFPLYTSDGDPLVYTGKKSSKFPAGDFISGEQSALNTLCAESLARGVRENLVSIADQIVTLEGVNLRTIMELRAKLQDTILRNARPSLNVTIHNAGGSAIVFRPYFGLGVLAPDSGRIDDNYLMVESRLDEKQQDDNGSPMASSPLLRLLSMSSGNGSARDPVGNEFLPQGGGNRYPTVAPGETVEIKLSATTQLGAQAAKYRAAYTSGLLRVKLAALTLDGKEIWSDIHVFGDSINEEDQKIIENLLQ